MTYNINLKRISLSFIISIVLVVILGTTSAFAYSGTFSFEITHSVTGTKKHSLADKEATVSAKATSSPKKNGEYTVSLKSGLSEIVFGNRWVADGRTKKKSKKTKKKSYVVKVVNHDRTTTTGSGTISQ